jgi:hypothetical protein
MESVSDHRSRGMPRGMHLKTKGSLMNAGGL